jgi:hypothetical protein
MNIQTLNSKQEKKLLKLFERFFPEYYIPTIQPNGFINVAEHNVSSDYIDLIHWYQFCFAILPEKMIDTLNDEDDSEEMYELNYLLELTNISQEHPVDYLYDLYKDYKKYFKNGL